MDTKSKYLDKGRRFRTQSLFVETFDKKLSEEGYEPIFSLTGKDGYPNFKHLFLETNDPTGYKFAIDSLGSYPHLQHLLSLKWFQMYWDAWQEEMEVKLRSQSICALYDTATQEGSKGTTAAKWLADKGWMQKRGRPSNAEVAGEKRKQARIKDELAEDSKRIGLH